MVFIYAALQELTNHVVAIFHQACAEMGADEARTASDEDTKEGSVGVRGSHLEERNRNGVLLRVYTTPV